MNCYETTGLLTVAAVSPYVIEAASRWLSRTTRRYLGARRTNVMPIRRAEPAESA